MRTHASLAAYTCQRYPQCNTLVHHHAYDISEIKGKGYEARFDVPAAKRKQWKPRVWDIAVAIAYLMCVGENYSSINV